jgi:hypothetical protein
MSSSPDSSHQELISWLQEQGYTPEETGKILQKLDEYDQQTLHESIFDSIADGRLNLAALIQEALQ